MDVLVDGFEAVRSALGRLEKLSKQPDAIAKDFGIVIKRAIARAFSQSRAPEIVAPVEGGKAEQAAGAQWAPLAESTLQRRRKGKKKSNSVKILIDRGTMKMSIGQLIDNGAVTVGSGIEYGPYHQGGTPRMPARPFVGYNNEDQQAMVKIVLRHIEEAVR